jgi:ribonuclease HII
MIFNEEIENDRIKKMLCFEKELWNKGIKFVAGIDEAGRGPLAGPVVAAAVVFSQDIFIARIDDSKKISPKLREELYEVIHEKAVDLATGIVTEKEIDRINILKASFRAMHIAVGSLSISPEHLLIDGCLALPEKLYPQTPVIKGDQKCLSIAAASIVAKVTRDRMMVEYDKHFPQYGFARNKGYGTKQHVEAIRKHGYCKIHRKSFHLKGWVN